MRQWASHALGEIGPDASSATAALSKALNDGNPFVRLKAAEALWRIDRRTNDGTAHIVLLLGHDSWLVRHDAALTLGPWVALLYRISLSHNSSKS